VVNCDLIEHIETTPDTVIALTRPEFMVLETPDQVVDRCGLPPGDYGDVPKHLKTRET